MIRTISPTASLRLLRLILLAAILALLTVSLGWAQVSITALDTPVT